MQFEVDFDIHLTSLSCSRKEGELGLKIYESIERNSRSVTQARGLKANQIDFGHLSQASAWRWINFYGLLSGSSDNPSTATVASCGVFVIIKVGVKLHDGTPINICVRIHALQRCDIKEKNVQKVNFYLTVLEQVGSF